MAAGKVHLTSGRVPAVGAIDLEGRAHGQRRRRRGNLTRVKVELELGAGMSIIPASCTQPGVFASLWEGNDLRLWTLVNRTESAIEGPLLRAASKPGDRYFDLITGSEAPSRAAGPAMILSGALPPRAAGCFIAGQDNELGKDFQRFLKRQAQVNARSVSDSSRPQAQTGLRVVKPTKLRPDVPDGMVEIPAATLELSIEMRIRECGFYELMPQADAGLQDSYGFRVRNFRRRIG